MNRPLRLLDPFPCRPLKARYIPGMTVTAGCDIGGTKVRAALVDCGSGSSGAILQRVSAPTDPKAGTSSIVSALAELLEIAEQQPAGIGVGIAAYTEYPAGKVAFAPNLVYDDPNVTEVIRRRFGLPVAVENDANAAAWGEYRFGAGEGIGDMVMVTVGTGIGGGIIISGQLYRGHRGFAAEIGHMTILADGPQCACGEKGCLEALASGTAITREARIKISAGESSAILDLAGGDLALLTGEMVTEAASTGDELALRVMRDAGRYLGVGLASLAHLLDPEIFVIGGGAAGAGSLILDPARTELEKRLAGRREAPKVVVATLGDDAGVIGAADLVREQMQRA